MAEMTGRATSARKRDRLGRWWSHLASSSASGANQADRLSPSSTASKPSQRKHLPLPPSAESSPPPIQTPGPDTVAYSPLPACQSVRVSPTSPTVASALDRDLLDSAWQRLSPQEQASIPKHILPTDDIDSVIANALSAAQEKRKLCENRRWTFTIGGHTVRLRDEADAVILWLDRLKKVGDIAVNVDPMHAGLPWAGIRLLLGVRIWLRSPPF